MILLLSSFGVSVASALIPLINIELYLATVSATGAGAAVGVALVAAAGQTVGKIVWYEVVRRSIESPWAQKKLSGPRVRASYDKWMGRLQGRPWYGGAVMFLAASVGIPPLLVMAAVAGALRMPMVVFLPTVFVGRALRFWLVITGVDLALG